MLHTLFVLAIVFGTIGPLLDTETMLLIGKPLTFISTSVEMCINTISIRFILGPLTLVNVTFSVNKSAIAIGHAIAPEAIIT